MVREKDSGKKYAREMDDVDLSNLVLAAMISVFRILCDELAIHSVIGCVCTIGPAIARKAGVSVQTGHIAKDLLELSHLTEEGIDT